ncbi:peptide chain release factor N(5)-glutamine methyltransferase [Desulfonema magnum]|uniref:Release factor glutamine methyltransferase n=1 Tax=Desulfonema magnum TaxID=45655 RepID=A0A975BNW4_9BACT|nr:peptide chain release factor N(5)-glutamine methyltransferase [Desulfonema magnum]QTA88981.1 Release factor glutamine methyltransferase [Desulfonema magnum]
MQTQAKIEEPQWTVRKVLSWTISYFKSHNIENPKSDAAILLAHALNLKRIDVYLQYDKPLCPDELAQFKALIKRRVRREPVAYIVGSKGFWSADLAVTTDVLIPRPETERLVDTALSVLPESEIQRILELGTGSGAITIALASERPDCIFFACDRSVKAAELARKNAVNHDVGACVHFFSGDWFSPLNPGLCPFDMIVSNPPYIRTRVISQLEPEIYKYEPMMALDGGTDGLDAVRHIIRSAPAYLVKGGHLLLEIGHDQKDDVRKIAEKCGCYEKIVFVKDYAGHDRVVHMRKKC